MLRELRRSDLPRVVELMRLSFPEEEALLGSRPGDFARVGNRLFRLDTRILLAVLRAVGRSPARFFVAEEGGTLVATTLTSFPARVGYISMVMVDPAFRRRGLARRLLERAREATVQRGRPYLALDVLDANGPARTLYESLGYRPLRPSAYFVRDAPADLAPATGPAAPIRPFEPRDAPGIVAANRAVTPAPVQEVLPMSERAFRDGGFGAAIFNAESASWVVDRGRGAEAYCGAVVPRAMDAAHLRCPVLGPTVPPDLATALVRTAAGWLGSKGAPRIVTRVPADLTRARAAVESVGFRHAIPITTFYRTAA